MLQLIVTVACGQVHLFVGATVDCGQVHLFVGPPFCILCHYVVLSSECLKHFGAKRGHYGNIPHREWVEIKCISNLVIRFI
jgi:hypothetical protein